MIDPNPYSPYADADPQYRHLFPALVFVVPLPGVLALTACDKMAVVPTDPLQELNLAAAPEGICPACVHVAGGGEEPEPGPLVPCRVCERGTRHGDLCALCRQDEHEQWWPTRGAGEGPSW